MQNIMLFEDFDPNPNFDGITLQDLQAKTPVELAWFVLGYTKHQARAWGQWVAKHPDELSMILGKISKMDREWGNLEDKDVMPLGKFLKDPKNSSILADLVSLFNRTYPGVDYTN
jgi:hypothetical protein